MHLPYIIPGIVLISCAGWLLYSIFKGKGMKPDGSKFGVAGLTFWCLGTGIWFAILQFDFNYKYRDHFIILIQFLSIIWILPIIIYRKIRMRRKD